MKIKLHKRFRGVLSLLVAVMLLVGVMPLSAVQVHATPFTVYFAQDKGSAMFGHSYIHAWNSGGSVTGSGDPVAMTYVDGSMETYGYKIYKYDTFSSNPTSIKFAPWSNWTWQTVEINGSDLQDGYVYWTTNESNMFSVDHMPFSNLQQIVFIMYATQSIGNETGDKKFGGYINYHLASDAPTDHWEKMNTYDDDYYGFNIYYKGFYEAPISLQMNGNGGGHDSETITGADKIQSGHLYYRKDDEVFSFPFTDLTYGALTSTQFSSNMNKDVNVIVDNSETFVPKNERHYVKATMYDYFSDYELLNGRTRTGGNGADVVNGGITVPYGTAWEDPCRRMQHPTFDTQLSGYYRESMAATHPLYFGDIHDEGGGYYFSTYNANQWGLYYKNLTGGTTGGNVHNEYQQLYHDNNSTRRSGLDVTDKTQSAFAAATGLYATSLSAYNKTASNTTNAARLTLTGGANAKWFDDTWLSAGNGNTHNSTGKMIGASYDVDFPFWTINMARTIGSQTYNSCQYYYINSEKPEHALRMHKGADGRYYLKETGQGIYNYSGNDYNILHESAHYNDALSSTYGFFPFNSKQDFYTSGTWSDSGRSGDINDDLGGIMDPPLRLDRTNYCFGTYMVIPFTLTSNNGTVNGTTDATDTPITFSFSGDDDLLVYIDNQLVLDIGGDHGKVQGEINLKEKKSWVSSVKTTTGTATQNITWSGTEKLQTMSAIPSSGAGVTTLADALCAKGEHVMEIFYVERGLFDSNMEIMYNLPVVENRSFTVEEHIPTSDDLVGKVDSVFTSGSTGATNFMNNVDKIKLGINVQFSEPNETSNFGTLLGGRTEYTGDHPANYTFGSTLYENTFVGDTTNNIYTTTMSNGQKLTYVNDFIKHYNYNLKVWEGNIFIKTGIDENGKEICTDTNRDVSHLFTTSWKLRQLSNAADEKAAQNAGPATTATATTSGSSRPKRAAKTTSTSATNNSNGFDFRGTQANPDQIEFYNTMNTYPLRVSKEFHRKTDDTATRTFTIKVYFNNVGGLNLEEPNAATPANGLGIVLEKELTFTFSSSEGTGTDGTTKYEDIVVPANTVYKVIETTDQTSNGYAKSGEVGADNDDPFAEPVLDENNRVSVTVVNRAPQAIILKVQKVWENTTSSTAFPTSVKFLVEKSTDGTAFTPMTSDTVVNASGQAVSGDTLDNSGYLTLTNAYTTTINGNTVWLAYIYDDDNVSTNTYRVTEYDGNTPLGEGATYKPTASSFKVKYSETGFTSESTYTNATETGLTRPSGVNADYGNGSPEGGRVLTLSVLNRAFIKIRVQSYFTQKNEAQQTGLPSTSPYVKMKVQQYNTSTSQWENVKNDANTDTSEVSITSAAWTDTNPDPQRKYFEYVLDGEYDPDYTYRVLEYASGNDTTPIENGGSFSEVFAKVNYSFDAAQKKNERDGTDFDSSWSGVKGITLAVLNSGDGSSEIVNTGGRGGYVPIAVGFIAVLLAGAGYFIYKKRIFA